MRRNTAVINFCEYHSQCIELSLSSGRKGSEWEEDSDSRCWLALKKKHLLVKTESTVILIHCQGKASFSSSTLHKQASKTKGQRDAYIRGYLFGFPTAWTYPLEKSDKQQKDLQAKQDMVVERTRVTAESKAQQLGKGPAPAASPSIAPFPPWENQPPPTSPRERKPSLCTHWNPQCLGILTVWGHTTPL